MNPMKIRVSTHIFYHFQCGTQGFSVFSPLIITSSSEHRKYQFLIHFMLFFQHTTLMNPMKFISVLFSFWFFSFSLLHWISSRLGLTLGASCNIELPRESVLQWVFYFHSSTNSCQYLKPLSPIKQRLFIINHKIA